MHRRMMERRIPINRRRDNPRTAFTVEKPTESIPAWLSNKYVRSAAAAYPQSSLSSMPAAATSAPASKTAPTSPIDARPPLALSSDFNESSLAAAVGCMSRSTSCCSIITSDTHISDSEDGTSSASLEPPAPPPHRVTFNESVRVRLIPSRLQMAVEGTLGDTCWSPSDFREFRSDFVARARNAGLMGGSPRAGRCILSFRGDALLKTVESEGGNVEGRNSDGDEEGSDIQAVHLEIKGNESEEMERRRSAWLEHESPDNAEGEGATQMPLSQSSAGEEPKSPRGFEESDRGFPGFVKALMGQMFVRTFD